MASTEKFLKLGANEKRTKT